MNEKNFSSTVVNTHNEWDPFEEIIVGIIDRAIISPWDIVMKATIHNIELWDFYSKFVGLPCLKKFSFL